MLIQRETPDQIDAIRAVTAAAFRKPAEPDRIPVEAPLVDELRATDAWLPALSLVALIDGQVVGHVVCTRARLESAPALGREPRSAAALGLGPRSAAALGLGPRSAAALGLGPLSVHPDHQRRGVGLALVHAVLGAADALDEPLVVLLGSPRYYHRFGFRLAEEYGISPPVPEWRPDFQVRTLASYTPDLRGRFAYAEPFDRV